MKSAIAFCLFLAVGASMARPEDKYTDRYDDVDLEQILANRRLLVPYMDCALEKGKCTPDGKELKSHIREALENECAKCTETQRKGTERVIGHLVNHEPDYWRQLSSKYDPQGKYTSKYEKELHRVQG